MVLNRDQCLGSYSSGGSSKFAEFKKIHTIYFPVWEKKSLHFSFQFLIDL